MDQTLLGVGTRLQHQQYGPGVIVNVKYATYIISFINQGIKEVDKTDTKLDDIIPENISTEIEVNRFQCDESFLFLCGYNCRHFFSCVANTNNIC